MLQQAIAQHMRGAIQMAPLPLRVELEAILPNPDMNVFWTALAYWSGRVVGSHDDAAALVLAALLLARRASGVLDDLQDRDTADALWLRLGPEQTINVGLALNFAGQHLLAQLAQRGVPAATVVACLDDWAQVGVRMCGGQFREGHMAISHPGELTLADYQVVVEGKSASFCGFSCRLAAQVAGATGDILASFEAFGQQVGFLHQIYNDIAALHGERGKKDVGRRWTFPTLYALTSPSAALRAALLGAWQAGQEEVVVQLVIESGALHALLLRINDHYALAQEALGEISGEPEALSQLHALLARFLPSQPTGPIP